MKKIKQLFTWQLLLGAVIGGIAGFAYYYFIGCNSGSCPITSNPYNTTTTFSIYGALFVLFNNIDKNRRTESKSS